MSLKKHTSQNIQLVITFALTASLMVSLWAFFNYDPFETDARYANSVNVAYAADADGNGESDEIDYLIWQKEYHSYAQGIQKGDFNLDGKINSLDYIVWLNNH